MATAQQMTVDCVRASDAVDSILQRHGRIDVLKIDIEGSEADVMLSLPLEQRKRIGKIFAETAEGKFERNPFPETHTLRQYGAIAQFYPLQS